MIYKWLTSVSLHTWPSTWEHDTGARYLKDNQRSSRKVKFCYLGTNYEVFLKLLPRKQIWCLALSRSWNHLNMEIVTSKAGLIIPVSLLLNRWKLLKQKCNLVSLPSPVKRFFIHSLYLEPFTKRGPSTTCYGQWLAIEGQRVGSIGRRKCQDRV